MNKNWLFLLVIFAGCSGQNATSQDDAAAHLASYAEASRTFEIERQRYEKAVASNSDAIADQKEKLDAAKLAKDAAFAREHPATKDEMDKAFGEIHRK
jgi:hypothetical protein